MKVSFILGSGISQPAGLPSVEEITAAVLAPGEFYRRTKGVERRSETDKQRPEFFKMRIQKMEPIEPFLRWLKGLAEVRYAAQTTRKVNYEDLAYLAAQIRDDSLGEYENPALGPLNCCAMNALPCLCTVEKLGELAKLTVNYIADVVIEKLAIQPSRTDHLSLFGEAASDNRFEEVNFFTLNHDWLLERFLKSNGVAVVDGFGEEDGLGIRKWNPALFDCCRTDAPTPTVRVFKLHGSIDWRRYRPWERQVDETASNPWREEYVGIRSNSNLADNRDADGRPHVELDRPRLLTGTFNKMLGYLNHVFLELHYRFHRTLTETTRLIVCGYGFGDKGINHRIVDWMVLPSRSGRRKMILIEPRSIEDVCGSSRRAISEKLMSWNDEGRLVHLQFGIDDQEVAWEAVSTELLKSS